MSDPSSSTPLASIASPSNHSISNAENATPLRNHNSSSSTSILFSPPPPLTPHHSTKMPMTPRSENRDPNIHHVDTLDLMKTPVAPSSSLNNSALMQTPNLNCSINSGCSSCSSSTTASSTTSSSMKHVRRNLSSSKHAERIKDHPLIQEAKSLFEEKKYHSIVDILDTPLREGKESRYVMAESAYLSAMAFRSLKRFKKAKEYLLLAKKYMHPRALNALGVVCQQEGTNDEEALRYYRMAQEAHPRDSSAFYNAGLVLFAKARRIKSQMDDQFEKPAEEKTQSNNSSLSQSTPSGKGTKQAQLMKLLGATRKMFEKASRRGHSLAYNQLASLDMFEEKYESAHRHYSKGARKGDVCCMVALAELYIEGKYIAENRNEARKLLHEASVKHSSVQAKYFLAKMALQDEKWALAFEYYEQARRVGDSQFQLALLLLSGKGCEKDLEQAKKYLNEVRGDIPEATYHLALIFLEQNEKTEALELFIECRDCVEQVDASIKEQCIAHIDALQLEQREKQVEEEDTAVETNVREHTPATDDHQQAVDACCDCVQMDEEEDASPDAALPEEDSEAIPVSEETSLTTTDAPSDAPISEEQSNSNSQLKFAFIGGMLSAGILGILYWKISSQRAATTSSK